MKKCFFKDVPDVVCIKIVPMERMDPNANVSANERRCVERPNIMLSDPILIDGQRFDILALAYCRSTDNHKYLNVRLGEKTYFYDDTKSNGWLSMMKHFPESSTELEMVIVTKHLSDSADFEEHYV